MWGLVVSMQKISIGLSSHLLFRNCFVFSIKSIDSRILAAVSLPEGHQLLCIFRIFSSTDNSRPLLMIRALSVSSEPRCRAVRRSKAPPHNQQATQSTPPPPPSISQSTMKRVTIRAGALLFRSQCLLSNNIICHRGRNLGGCAPVLDSQYLHCFEVEKIVLLIHRRSRLRFKQPASLFFLHVWGS